VARSHSSLREQRCAMTPNPAIERTFQRPIRPLARRSCRAIPWPRHFAAGLPPRVAARAGASTHCSRLNSPARDGEPSLLLATVVVRPRARTPGRTARVWRSWRAEQAHRRLHTRTAAQPHRRTVTAARTPCFRPRPWPAFGHPILATRHAAPLKCRMAFTPAPYTPWPNPSIERTF